MKVATRPAEHNRPLLERLRREAAGLGLPIDDGLHFREVMAAVQAHGVPGRSLMPNTFGTPLNEIRPTPEAVLDASQRRDLVPIWYRVDEPEILARFLPAWQGAAKDLAAYDISGFGYPEPQVAPRKRLNITLDVIKKLFGTPHGRRKSFSSWPSLIGAETFMAENV